MINLQQETQRRLHIKTPLRGYQRAAVRRGIDLKHLALLMDPRLGKTRIDVALTSYWHSRNELSTWLIFCPSIAKQVWASEIQNTLRCDHQIILIEKSIPHIEADPGKLTIVISSHEMSWRMLKQFKRLSPCKVTVDESHKIKNTAAKQYRAIEGIGRTAKFRSILTGTFLSSPVDAFAQYKFLNPEVFGPVKKTFLETYVESWDYLGYTPKTFKNLDDLTNKINSQAFKLTRIEAKGFPQEDYQTVIYPLTGETLRHYKELHKDLLTTVQGVDVTAEIVLTKILRCQQLCSGFVVSEGKTLTIGDDRLKALLSLIDEFPVSEPLVIFARFTYEIQAIQQAVMRAGRISQTIEGSTRQSLRDKVRESFQAGWINTCIVQIQAGGMSIDLSRASICIMYSLTFSSTDHEQARARIISRGKSIPVTTIYLEAANTVDKDIIHAVRTKLNLADYVLKRG